MSENILEMRNITKLFPGVRALDDVNLQVKKGTIHALVGGERRRKVHPHERIERYLSLWQLHRRHCL